MSAQRSFFPILPTAIQPTTQQFIHAQMPGLTLQPSMILSQANIFAAQAAAAVSAVQFPTPPISAPVQHMISNTIKAEPKDEKPVEWVQYMNEEGKPYYHNRLTKVTTWIQPDHFKPASQNTLNSKSSISGRKNPWREYKNEEGKSYYHNAETKETTWTKPHDFDDLKPVLIESKLPSETSASKPSTALSDMEKAMQATLRNLTPTAEPSKSVPNPVDLNEAKQRQAEKFREVLVDKYNDGRIKTTMSWENALRQIQHDPRFRIINKVSEKKRIFNEWKTQQQKDERDARKLAVRKSKEDFEQFLLNHKKARPSMPFSKAERVFGHEAAWKALSESDRRDLYKESMELLRRKREAEEDEKRIRVRRLFTQFLDSMDSIEYRTTWAEAQRVLSECSEMSTDHELKSMHKLDMLEGFKDHIRRLEREHVEQREMKDKRVGRVERQIRDAFHELLHEYNQKGVITSTSTWVQTFPIFRQDTRFTKMLQQPGSTPLDVFKFYVEGLKACYYKDRRQVRDILEKSKREVTVETTLSNFEKWIREEDTTNEIDAGNLSLIFGSLVEKAAEKSKETLKPAPKKVKTEILSVDAFEKLTFNIRPTDKWEKVSERVMSDPSFADQDRAEVERLFDEYVKLLPTEELENGQVEEVAEKKTKEKKSKKSKKKDKKKKSRHERDRSRDAHTPNHSRRSEDRRRERSSDRGRRRRTSTDGDGIPKPKKAKHSR